MNIDAVASDCWTQDLRDGSSYSSVIHFHYAIPAACYADIGVFGQEFGAEDTIGVTIKFDAV